MDFYTKYATKRGYHSAVSMGNKMFVIGNHVGYKNSEVYDKVSNKFSFIKPPATDINCNLVVQRNSYCTGEKLVLFGSWSRESVSCFVYDVKKESWSVKETKFKLYMKENKINN